MRRLARKLLRRLASLTLGCGKLPVLAAFVLVAVARVAPALSDRPARVPERPLEVAPPPDFELIDSVLAKRAPDLGLTLRRQLGVAIAEEARQAGYDPLLILAIIHVESEFTDDAVSVAGARGLMQIIPSTLYFLADKEGLKLSREEVEADPALRVRLGIRYLRQLHNQFRDLDLALMAYNAGPTRLWQALKEHDLEQFRGYPRAVHRQYRLFREGEGLGGDWAFAQRGPFRQHPEDDGPWGPGVAGGAPTESPAR